MDQEKDPEVLTDLQGRDLSQWRMLELYCLAMVVDEGTMMPAVIKESRRIIWMPTNTCMEYLWKRVCQSDADVCSGLFLANLQLGIGFRLQARDPEKIKASQIFELDHLREMERTSENPFGWGYGVFLSQRLVPDPKFKREQWEPA